MNLSATPSSHPSSRHAQAPPALSSANMPWVWVALLGVAAALRLLFVARKSLWLDETISVAIARLGWADFARSIWQREANMALYYLLLRPFLRFGDSEFWVRLPSVLAGIAAAPVIYALGKAIFDRRVALLAAVLLSVNACHVVYSQEARGYGLAVLLSALSSLFFLHAVENPSWRNWLVYAVVSALAIYSHFLTGLVIFAQWLWATTLPSRVATRERFLAAALATVLFCSPAIAFVLLRHQTQLQWVPRPTVLELYRTAIFFAAEGGKVVGNLLLVLCLVALVRAGQQLRREWLSRQRSLPVWREAFLWYWLLVPIVLSAAVSPYASLFFHRFLIVCLPAFILLVARGLLSMQRRAVLLTVFTGLSLAAVFLSYSRTREDWRAATAYILGNAEAGDAILFDEPYSRTPVEYYEGRFRHAIHPVPVGAADVAERGGYRRLWVVIYPASTANPSSVAADLNLAARQPVLQEIAFRGPRVILFELSHGGR